MITGTEPFTDLRFKPPELQRNEVVFFGPASARSTLGKRVIALSEAWQEKHLPWAVPVPAAKFDRARIRTWLNKNVSGMWAFCRIEDDGIPFDGVRFSEQISASAFRIWWC